MEIALSRNGSLLIEAANFHSTSALIDKTYRTVASCFITEISSHSVSQWVFLEIAGNDASHLPRMRSGSLWETSPTISLRTKTPPVIYIASRNMSITLCSANPSTPSAYTGWFPDDPGAMRRGRLKRTDPSTVSLGSPTIQISLTS